MNERAECKRCGALTGPGPCRECGYREPDPDDYVQIQEDDPPTEPEEEDLLTEDHVRFFIRESEHRGPVVVVAEGQDWRREVKRYMLRERWYPNVWWVSDHGNPHLLNLNGEG